MATKVDICNVSLALLGDEATVTSIDPPEGSPQADHCQRFYPLALKQVLEEHPWGFATKRMKLATLAAEVIGSDKNMYQLPSDCVRVLDVQTEKLQGFLLLPQYAIENHNRGLVLVTAENNVWIKYITTDVEESVFPPNFTYALVRLLASLLAGSLVPGSSGVSMSNDQVKFYEYFLGLAKQADARQQRHREDYVNNFVGDLQLEDQNVFY